MLALRAVRAQRSIGNPGARLHGYDAAIDVLLPLIAVSGGLTAIGIVFVIVRARVGRRAVAAAHHGVEPVAFRLEADHNLSGARGFPRARSRGLSAAWTSDREVDA